MRSSHPQQQQQPSVSKKEQHVFIILIFLGIALCVFFGFRAVRSYIRLQRMELASGLTDVGAIRGWMTVPYIAAGYEVPEEYIFRKIGIPAEENQKKNLSQLNRQYAPGKKGEIIEAVKAAIREYQEEEPSPSGTDYE